MSTSFILPEAPPSTDPTRLFEVYRGNFQTELLACGQIHFRIFEHLAPGPLTESDLGHRTGLRARPLTVLLTALASFGTLVRRADGSIELSPLAREHLLPGGDYFVGDYFARAAETAGALEFADHLRSNRPKGSRPEESGVGYLFREGMKSAMEESDLARLFTLQLAGRAKNVAPVLAAVLPLNGAHTLLDVGGGTGIYTLAFLRRNPELRGIVWDRPEVLKITSEFARRTTVTDRLELRAGDMFADPVPKDADVFLLSNILHDWDVQDCQQLIRRCAEALPSGGRLIIHDVFLNDDLSGPLHAAMYSAHLFSVTEGRLYSAAECTQWLTEAGLRVVQRTETFVHASALVAAKP
ncbi:MAG: methyltransferase domain-containing protein [Pedosphaera sp.]|nr:methyltransferase domain-containing protein [Pedosphaera sp.]